MSPSQYRAQPPPHKLILSGEHILHTVTKVSKPPFEHLVHIRHHLPHRSRVQSARFLPDRFSKFVDALLPWPPMAPFEVIPQKVESAFLARIHNARLGRMQRSSRRFRPLAQVFKHVSSLLWEL